jgi:uncharacterized protein (TIGR03435 family)
MINAKAEESVSEAVKPGTHAAALPEDRFRLKVHRESREVPVYALTVARGGLKLRPPGDASCTESDALGQEEGGRPFLPLGCSKLQRAREGDCIPRGSPPEPGQKPPCGTLRLSGRPSQRVVDLIGG